MNQSINDVQTLAVVAFELICIFYLLDLETVEYIKESVFDKYFVFAGAWEFVSNATMHDEGPKYYQDLESLGYVFVHGLNGGRLEWIPADGSVDLQKNIELKTHLNLDVSH